MLRVLVVVLIGCVGSDYAAAQTQAQLQTMDRVAAAKVAGEKCPSLRFEATAATLMLITMKIDVDRAPFDLPWHGRLFAARYLWDLDKDRNACEKALRATNLLSRR
jgi:hypothetical protein